MTEDLFKKHMKSISDDHDFRFRLVGNSFDYECSLEIIYNLNKTIKEIQELNDIYKTENNLK